MKLRIVEEPAEKSFRFRYESEGRKNVSITGASSTIANLTYPSIEISGYNGTVYIIVSCVTHKKPYRQHPHKVFSSINEKASRCGVLTLRDTINDQKVIEFKDIGIIFVKKADVKKSLEERKKANVNPFETDWDHIDCPKKIDYHMVRLCFQVVGMVNDKRKVLGAIVSNPIIDTKTNGSLKIVKISVASASMTGGQSVILLCDKVRREDIVVQIFEKDEHERTIWQKDINKDEKSFEVHHQYGIAFNMPAYRDPLAMTPRQCYIQLYRPSDGECSDSIPMELLPSEQSIQLRRKRQRTLNTSNDRLLVTRAQSNHNNDKENVPIAGASSSEDRSPLTVDLHSRQPFESPNISPAASNVASMSTANYTPPDNDNNFMYAEPPQSHYIPPHMNVMPHIHYQQYPVRNDAVHNDQFSAQYKPYYANAGEYAFGDQRRYDPSAHMPISCDNMAAMGEPGPMPKTEADNAMNTDESIEKFRSSQLMVLDQFRNEDYLTSSVERFELLC